MRKSMIKAQRDDIDNALIINQATRDMYMERLCDLAVSRFNWRGMPDSIDTRYLELTLLQRGMCAFFYDDVLGYLCLPAVTKGKLGVYGIPEVWTAYSDTGANYPNLTAENSVLIWNNLLHTCPWPILQQYANRLYETQRAIDVNISLTKYPVLIQCPEEERLTFHNLFAKYTGNIPLIFASDKLNIKGVEAINTKVPVVFPDLQIQLKSQWGEALTYLGIENNSINKAERQITDEVISSLGNVYASRWSATAPRENACAQINKLFGLNISVEFRAELIANVEPVIEDDNPHQSPLNKVGADE